MLHRRVAYNMSFLNTARLRQQRWRRNKWTKSEIKLQASEQSSEREERRKNGEWAHVGGHFYLQIFNVKWMNKVEYISECGILYFFPSPHCCCCSLQYARMAKKIFIPTTMGVHDDSRNLTNSEHVACCATPVKDVINFSLSLTSSWWLFKENVHYHMIWESGGEKGGFKFWEYRKI